MVDREIFYQSAKGPIFGEFVSVSRFVVTEGQKNLLLLRCFNRGDRTVTGLRIAVHLLDGTAETGHKEFSFSGLSGKPGTEFAVPDIPLPASRRNVRVEILTACTFDREYDFRDGSTCYVGAPPRRTVRKCDKTSRPLVKYGAIVSALMLLLVSVSVLIFFLKAERTENGAETVCVEDLGTDEAIC